jgi:hypothetical protein
MKLSEVNENILAPLLRGCALKSKAANFGGPWEEDSGVSTVETRYNDPRYSDILSNTIQPYGPALF